MTKEEFNKIIEVNPEAKFKLVGNKGCVVFFPTEAELTFVSYEDEEYLGIFSCEGEPYVQSVWFCDIAPIAESVTLKPNLKFPCCIATSEIKDEETLKKVQDLFVANGATLEEPLWCTCQGWEYYGVDYDNETYFLDKLSLYGDGSSQVTVYTLKDLFPETEEETVVEAIADSHPWIEWDCTEFETPPVEKGTLVDIKWRDGRESVGLSYGDQSVCPTTTYRLNSWGEGYRATVVAYRLHNSASVASQEASSEVLVKPATQGTTIAQSDVHASTAQPEGAVQPFKVVKHTYYDVTIKGEPFRFSKEDVNLLCTLLVEAIGEDYEPS
jgi:hypothetical protein